MQIIWAFWNSWNFQDKVHWHQTAEAPLTHALHGYKIVAGTKADLGIRWTYIFNKYLLAKPEHIHEKHHQEEFTGELLQPNEERWSDIESPRKPRQTLEIILDCTPWCWDNPPTNQGKPHQTMDFWQMMKHSKMTPPHGQIPPKLLKRHQTQQYLGPMPEKDQWRK